MDWQAIKKKIFPRDLNYYFGLLFLAVASTSIFWCWRRDSFEPMDFILFFLFYCAGFALLWKSDTTLRIACLLEEIHILKKRNKSLEETMQKEIHALEQELADMKAKIINHRAIRRKAIYE